MTWIRRAGRGGIAAVATALVLACDDEPSGPGGSIQLAVNPAALSVPQGGSGSVTASLTRGGGFSNSVTLEIAGLPAGVTTTITPAQLSGATASATVDVTVAGTVALGVYTATITATAQGVTPASATYQVTVTEAPDYGLTVDPTALTIVAGTSGNATVGIDRTNFTGGVALALLNPPAGLTGGFNPTPSTTDESALVVSVAANVAPGAYPLTIQGTATGPGTRTTALTVTVPAPPTGGNVEYLFCDPGDVPAFFAYQDGTGAWQAVTGATSGGATRFAFNLTQGHGGVLRVYRTAGSAAAGSLTADRGTNLRQMLARRSGIRDRLHSRFSGAPGRSPAPVRSAMADTYETFLLYATTAELAQEGLDACAQPQPTKAIRGTVVGVPAGAYGIVSLGGITEVFNGAVTVNPITFSDVPPGPVDLVGSRTTPGATPDRVVVFRNLNVPDGGALPSVIDFAGPASSAPATANATITGGAGDDLEIFSNVVTANGEAGLWFDLAPSPVSTRPWAGLSPAAMVTGDFHALVAFATPQDEAGFRVTLKYVGPVANQDLVLGPVLDEPTTTQVAGGAYPRFRFQGTVPVEYNKGVSIDVLSAQGFGNFNGVLMSGGYLAAAGNALVYDFTMPDVINVAGFPAAARLTAGPTDVFLGAFGFTGTGTFDLPPTLGGEFRAATRNATITVP